MRVVYQWTQAEWDEAMRLATKRQRRRGGIPGTTYAVILIPVVGASLSGLLNLRHEGALTGAGIVVPLLLGMVALCVILWVVGMVWKRQRRRATAAPLPVGECEAILQENGWRFRMPGHEDSAADALQGSVAEDEDGAIPVSLDAVQAAATEDNSTENCIRNDTSPSSAKKALSSWVSLTGTRRGNRVVVFLHEGGFSALPIRCLTENQAGHMQRLISRKLRPQPGHAPITTGSAQ